MRIETVRQQRRDAPGWDVQDDHVVHVVIGGGEANPTQPNPSQRGSTLRLFRDGGLTTTSRCGRQFNYSTKVGRTGGGDSEEGVARISIFLEGAFGEGREAVDDGFGAVEGCGNVDDAGGEEALEGRGQAEEGDGREDGDEFLGWGFLVLDEEAPDVGREEAEAGDGRRGEAWGHGRRDAAADGAARRDEDHRRCRRRTQVLDGLVDRCAVEGRAPGALGDGDDGQGHELLGRGEAHLLDGRGPRDVSSRRSHDRSKALARRRDHRDPRR
mmetsp:Transcript_1289/g.3289  ORF Transcript_1289/g.3289 Transcript_1289/m.3289 type:complete len:270 (+) Transcript_1289:196-1005(+)